MQRAIALFFVVSYASQSASYDFASSCSRPHRSSRARPAAPCDLGKHHYCTTPGHGYPWHAIRRFVRENQGLMKRMYGEERHISVLKAELENFIDDDDEENAKPPEFSEDIIKTKLKYSKQRRAMKVKPHFRPITTSSPDKAKKPDKYNLDTLKVKPLNKTNNPTNTTEAKNATATNDIVDKGIAYKTKLESIANVEINNLDPEVITLEAVIKQTIETNSIYNSFETEKKPQEPAIVNDELNVTIAEKSVSVNQLAENSTEITTAAEALEDFTTTEATENIKESWKPMIGDASTLPPTLLFSEHEKEKNTESNETKEEFHLKPNHHQESVKPSVIKLRGANACETKEEMAAPFWANSTRGEVLALLNMYPFEQYVHLETCARERSQMYCREGCRCEQQYRLHRLLAYDPRNECRGIFADWFKFPACCVCRCYDVPLEFRARSPRILHPQYDEDIKRAIYEDVARDWYAMGYDEMDEDFD